MRLTALLLSTLVFAGGATTERFHSREELVDVARQCVGEVLRNYPPDFAGGVSSMYKFRLGQGEGDAAQFLRGVSAIGATFVALSINGEDFIIVVPSGPAYSREELSEQVRAVCELLASGSMLLVEYQHTASGQSAGT